MAKLKFSTLAFVLVLTCFLMFSTLSPVYSLSGTPQLQWQRFFNGTHGYSVLETPDGGYIIAAINQSSSLLIRTDSLGNILWEKNVEVVKEP